MDGGAATVSSRRSRAQDGHSWSPEITLVFATKSPTHFAGAARNHVEAALTRRVRGGTLADLPPKGTFD